MKPVERFACSGSGEAIQDSATCLVIDVFPGVPPVWSQFATRKVGVSYAVSSLDHYCLNRDCVIATNPDRLESDCP